MAYVPVEQALRTWLAAQIPAARVVTETPAGMVAVLPVIQVVRFGGADEDFPQFDNANVDVDVFHTSRTLARELADEVRVLIRTQLEGSTISGAYVLRARTMSAPIWVAYDDTNIRRFTAAYTVRIHHPALT